MGTINIKDMSRIDWLAHRRNSIGGSDVSAIMHCNNFKTALDLYLEKIGKRGSDPDNAKMEAGRRFEGAIAQWFADKTGLRIREFHQMFTDEKQPYIHANPDRQILATENEHPLLTETNTGILEVKRTSINYMNMWQYEVALPWYLQLQHYLTIKGYSYGYIVWNVRETDEVHWKRFDADDEVQKNIREACYDFWVNHVEDRNPPADSAEKQEVIDAIAKPIAGKTTKLDDDMWHVYKDFLHARDKRKKWKEKENILKSSLELFAGSSEKITHNGRVAATYIENTYDKFSSTALKDDDPDTYKKYKRPFSRRVLRPKIKLNKQP